MQIFFIQTEEYHLVKALKAESISFFAQLNNCNEGDYLIFLVNKKIAGYARFIDDGLNIQFEKIIESDNRQNILGYIRNLFIQYFGEDFHAAIRQHSSINFDQKFISYFDDFSNDLNFYLTELDYLLEELESSYKEQEIKFQEEKVINDFSKPVNLISGSTHTKSQLTLKKIGDIVECDTWIASNDHHKQHKGTFLMEGTLKELPQMTFSEDVKKRIGLIDTIWFKGNIPICAFETETTTSVYSGILRMADLLTVMPSSNMKMYIVAPLERKNKVLREMNRPLFQAAGLTDYCAYVPLENLEVLYQKVNGLKGFISPYVLDAISISPRNYQF